VPLIGEGKKMQYYYLYENDTKIVQAFLFLHSQLPLDLSLFRVVDVIALCPMAYKWFPSLALAWWVPTHKHPSQGWEPAYIIINTHEGFLPLLIGTWLTYHYV
jgi:hypothetical protein